MGLKEKYFKFLGWDWRIRGIILLLVIIPFILIGIYGILTGEESGFFVIYIGILVILAGLVYISGSKTLVKGKFFESEPISKFTIIVIIILSITALISLFLLITAETSTLPSFTVT